MKNYKNNYLKKAIYAAVLSPMYVGLLVSGQVATAVAAPTYVDQIEGGTYNHPDQDVEITWPKGYTTKGDGAPVWKDANVTVNSLTITNLRDDYRILEKGFYANFDNPMQVKAKTITITAQDDGIYTEGNGSLLVSEFNSLTINPISGYGIVNNNNICNTSGGNGKPVSIIGNKDSIITIKGNDERPAVCDNSATSIVEIKAGTVNLSSGNKAGSGNGLAAGGTVTTAYYMGWSSSAVGGTVNIDGDNLVKIINTANSAALNAYLGDININQNSTGTVEITGDVLASKKGNTNVNFVGAGSKLTGALQAVDTGVVKADFTAADAAMIGDTIAKGGTVNATFSGAKASQNGNITAGTDGGSVSTTTKYSWEKTGSTVTKQQNALGGTVNADFTGANANLTGNLAAQGVGVINANFTGNKASMIGDITAGTVPSTSKDEYDKKLFGTWSEHVTTVTNSIGGNGTVNANFFGANSTFTGKVTTLYNPINASLPSEAATNLTLSNGSTWNMTANSNVTKLALNGSTINMQQSGNGIYDTLTTEKYSGTGGNMVMDTDLASQTNGDKLVINTGSEAGTTSIQVYDASLLNGSEVIGPKNLLLVTGASDGTNFTGKSLDKGGLWETIPTIQKGTQIFDENGKAIGTADQWYLSMLVKKPNPGTQDVLHNFEESYGYWRNSLTDDTLRKRLGDLRYDKKQAGMWTRIKGGQINGAGFDSDYIMYQLGYDKLSGNTAYGAAFDYNRGHGNYSEGGNSDTTMGNLSLYATNYRKGPKGSDGTYSDLVLKVGKLGAKMDSYGAYPDSFDYSTWGYSASYELGKTIGIRDQWFIEPQSQFVLGHLNSVDFTTDRGTVVNKDAYNSALGRLGVVIGRRVPDKDFYAKFNVWHDFGGTNDVDLLATNGESMASRDSLSGTFYEFGLGGNVVLSNGTNGARCHLYGDALRTFGTSIAKTWQLNLGLRWEF